MTDARMADVLPISRPFLTAEWRYLVMLNYEVSPALLAPLVPRGTELDLWQGRALVSLVGFRFLNTRVRGIPVLFHRNFDEVNLRFYVRRRTAEAERRAVVFIREVVSHPAIAWLARWSYNEPYVALPMRHRVQMDGARDGQPGLVQYQWRQERWYTLAADTAGSPEPPAPDSEAEFVTEHYWGYTSQRDGGCIEYQVAHPRWRVWTTTRASLDCDIDRMYGRAWVQPLSAAPCSALIAEGSMVAVYPGKRLRGLAPSV